MNPLWLILIIPLSIVLGLIGGGCVGIKLLKEFDKLLSQPPNLKVCNQCKKWIEYCHCEKGEI